MLTVLFYLRINTLLINSARVKVAIFSLTARRTTWRWKVGNFLLNRLVEFRLQQSVVIVSTTVYNIDGVVSSIEENKEVVTK